MVGDDDLVPAVWPLDSLHVVGGIETHAPVLSPLAPALLILVLQLLKLVPCNINCDNIVTSWVTRAPDLS